MPSASHKVMETSVPVIKSNVCTSRIAHARTAHCILIWYIYAYGPVTRKVGVLLMSILTHTVSHDRIETYTKIQI